MTSALCYCGRPLRHCGKHWNLNADGSRARKSKPAARPRKLKLTSEVILAEIECCLADIENLRREINQRKDRLAEVEARLQALRPLCELYETRALPPPAAAPAPAADSLPVPVMPKPIHVAPVPATSRVPARPPPRPPRKEADYEPVEVNFDQVSYWAAKRGVEFNKWDDLPAVNRKREHLELPLFKRKLSARAA